MRANEAFFFLSLGDLIQHPISSFLHLFISVLWFCFSLQLSRAPLRVSIYPSLWSKLALLSTLEVTVQGSTHPWMVLFFATL